MKTLHCRERAAAVSALERVKAAVRRLIDEFLVSLKLPRGVKLGEHELRYMIWKSRENLTNRTNSPTSPLSPLSPTPDPSPVGRGATRGNAGGATAAGVSVGERILDAFKKSVRGELKGKPIVVGRLTEEGRQFLEGLSGVKMKEHVDFVLNPSDMVHIYKGHFGNNEKDKGNNIPLTEDDIQKISDVITSPTQVLFGRENDAQGRKMFYFLKDAGNGSYNLLEIYSNGRGNLTAKTFYKTRKDAAQRAMSLSKSPHLTSVTGGAILSSGAKIPNLFETEAGADDGVLYRDDDRHVNGGTARAVYEAYKAKNPKKPKTEWDFMEEFRKKDYSGLTGLLGIKDVGAAEAEAARLVADMEFMADTRSYGPRRTRRRSGRCGRRSFCCRLGMSQKSASIYRLSIVAQSCVNCRAIVRQLSHNRASTVKRLFVALFSSSKSA